MSSSQDDYTPAAAQRVFEMVKKGIDNDTAGLLQREQELRAEHRDLLAQSKIPKAQIVTLVQSLPNLLKEVLHSQPQISASSTALTRHNTTKLMRLSLQKPVSQFSIVSSTSQEIVFSAEEGLLKASHSSSEAMRMGNEYAGMKRTLTQVMQGKETNLKQLRDSNNTSQAEIIEHAQWQGFIEFHLADREKRQESMMNVVKYTWFIPGVNVLVTPWSALRARHHKKKAAVMRSISADNELVLEKLILQGIILIVREGMASSILHGLRGIDNTIDVVIEKCGIAEKEYKRLVDDFGRVSVECNHLIDEIETMILEWTSGIFTSLQINRLRVRARDLLSLVGAPDHVSLNFQSAMGSISLPSFESKALGTGGETYGDL